jgi:hypothetical protein
VFKLSTFELEHNLRNSNAAYPFKATRYIYGGHQIPCPDCPYKDEYHPVPILKKTEDCFKRCPFEICLWILSKEQLEIYEKVRPLEKKKKDIELAISKRKIVALEETLGV